MDEIKSISKEEVELTNMPPYLEDLNEVVAEGNIIYMNDMEKVAFVKLAVLGGRKRDNWHYPSFIMGETLKEKLKDFKVGDRVRVTGQFTSSRGKDKTFKQNILATDIQPAQSILDKAFSTSQLGKAFEVPHAQFRVVGTVLRSRIVPGDGDKSIFKFIISTAFEENFHSNIEYTMFVRNLGSIADCLQVGARVCLVGEIQTSEEVEVGTSKKKHYQHNVIVDMKRIKDKV